MAAKRQRPKLAKNRVKENVMFDEENPVKEFTIDQLEALFNEVDAEVSEPQDNETAPPETQPTEVKEEKPSEDNSVENTKAFAKRLSEKTEQVRKEEREQIAKSLGYESYDSMMKSKLQDSERKVYDEHGLDPDQVAPVVEELVKQRLDNDPRLRELDEIRAQRVKEFGKQELAEITKLTNGEITSLTQIPKEVLDLWKQKGSLKQAYIEIKGEELIMKERSKQSNGSTAHLASPNGTGSQPPKTRTLTDQEKNLYKFFNPGVSDDELNKKRYNI